MLHFARTPKATAGFRSLGDFRERLNQLGLMNCYAATRWIAGALQVISSVEDAEYPDGQGVGPQWHLSITSRGKRATDREVKRVLKAFAVPRAEEDNHHPGQARHFWCPIDPAHRVDCQCKEDEVTVVEPDGYKWTNAPAAEECRGCEWEAKRGVPCAVHSAESAAAP